jgi:hypothetical protein
MFLRSLKLQVIKVAIPEKGVHFGAQGTWKKGRMSTTEVVVVHTIEKAADKLVILSAAQRSNLWGISCPLLFLIKYWI